MAKRTNYADRRVNGDRKAVSLMPEAGKLEKAPTGIRGLDLITNGGLPKGRATIVCGGPGCGKTVLAAEFLARGAAEYDEPGVLMAFEEPPEEITKNVRSIGFDLDALVRKKKLALDYLFVEPSEIQETGEYDLEGLFVRMAFAVQSVGAKRVVLDTPEALFSGFTNTGILRAEIRRLLRWLKDRHLTTVITAEKGQDTLTRYGLEEYVSDCVIVLNHRVSEQVSTRRMQIVKYRGTAHGENEYPFLIEDQGISVLPITSLDLKCDVSSERISSGIPALDQMLGGGFYRGSAILLSGTPGTGKTTLSSQIANATCQRGERCLFVSFEESRQQVVRNMDTVGIHLGRWIQNGQLHFEAWRPTQFGIESHLLRIHNLVERFKPHSVILDPITSLLSSSTQHDVRSLLLRLAYYLKEEGITSFLTNLTKDDSDLEGTEENISSQIDTWILLRDVEQKGERNRCIHVLKSRGMAHSNQVREFVLTSQGIRIFPAYVGAGQVLVGSSRLAQEAKETAEALARFQEIEDRRQELANKRQRFQAQVASLKAEFAMEERQLIRTIERGQQKEATLESEKQDMARSRKTNGKEEANPRWAQAGGKA